MTHIIEPTEKWTRCTPSPFLSGEYCLTKIEDTMDALNIFLTHNAGQHKIQLTYVAWAHRSTNETIRMGVIEELDKRYGTDFYAHWSFFKVENSSYINWLADQSYGHANDFKIQHFVIIGMHYIVDIAATDEPIVTILSDTQTVSLN